jgi:hypothetical protein
MLWFEKDERQNRMSPGWSHGGYNRTYNHVIMTGTRDYLRLSIVSRAVRATHRNWRIEVGSPSLQLFHTRNNGQRPRRLVKAELMLTCGLWVRLRLIIVCYCDPSVPLSLEQEVVKPHSHLSSLMPTRHKASNLINLQSKSAQLPARHFCF